MWYEVVRGAAELQQHRQAWQQLAEQAAEGNPFYEPWMLLPALESFGTGEIHVLLLYRASRRTDAPPEMCGLFPLHRMRLGRWPFHVWRLWQHRYDYSCVPLVRRDCATEAVLAAGNWVANEAPGRGLWDLHHITGDGLFASSLLEAARKDGWLVHCADTYHRAMLDCTGDVSAYDQGFVNSRTRQEQRRMKRRLAECGELETRIWDGQSDIDQWIRWFVELEQAGWKGREETALADNQTDMEYFESIICQGAARGRVAMLGLFLNGVPIALKCNFLSPPGSYAFKIAFDETFHRYSPGIQLELENIVWAHRQPELKWMDSCAVRDHFMINRLWHQRRQIQRLLISPGHRLADLAIGLIQVAGAARSALRSRSPAATAATSNPERN